MRDLSLNERCLAWSSPVIIVSIFCWLPVLGLHFICHPVIADSNPQFCKLNEVLSFGCVCRERSKAGQSNCCICDICTNVVCKLEASMHCGLLGTHFTTGRVQRAALQGLLLKYLHRQFKFIVLGFMLVFLQGTGTLLILMYLLLRLFLVNLWSHLDTSAWISSQHIGATSQYTEKWVQLILTCCQQLCDVYRIKYCSMVLIL